MFKSCKLTYWEWIFEIVSESCSWISNSTTKENIHSLADANTWQTGTNIQITTEKQKIASFVYIHTHINVHTNAHSITHTPAGINLNRNLLVGFLPTVSSIHELLSQDSVAARGSCTVIPFWSWSILLICSVPAAILIGQVQLNCPAKSISSLWRLMTKGVASSGKHFKKYFHVLFILSGALVRAGE